MYLYIYIFFFPRFEELSINLEPLISCWKRLVSLDGGAAPQPREAQEQGSNRLAPFNFSHMHMFPLFIHRKENPLQPPNLSAQPL